MIEEQKSTSEVQFDGSKEYFHVENGVGKLKNQDDSTVPLLDHSQKQNGLSEPLTHIKNRTFTQRYCCCFNSSADTNLTAGELRAFYTLKEQANTPFDSQSEVHNKLVGELWFNLFKEPIHVQILSPRWKEFGFQNNDPRTDFRGGGITALKMLIHYTETYPDNTKLFFGASENFLPAVSSINVTYYLLKYFHLAEFLIFEKDRAELGSRKALKNFCVFLSKDSDILFLIHDLLFTDLLVVWNDLATFKEDITIMDFKICFDEVKRKLAVAMDQNLYKTYEQFRLSYHKIPKWNGKDPKNLLRESLNHLKTIEK